jgi:hypothetical protein
MPRRCGKVPRDHIGRDPHSYQAAIPSARRGGCPIPGGRTCRSMSGENPLPFSFQQQLGGGEPSAGVPIPTGKAGRSLFGRCHDLAGAFRVRHRDIDVRSCRAIGSMHMQWTDAMSTMSCRLCRQQRQIGRGEPTRPHESDSADDGNDDPARDHGRSDPEDLGHGPHHDRACHHPPCSERVQ